MRDGKKSLQVVSKNSKKRKNSKTPDAPNERNTGGFALLKNFFNAFQPVAYRRPAVMGLRCNVRQWKPLNVPQKSYLSVNPPKRCTLDGGGHLLPVKSLQRSGQHHASRRHRQHRARRAAAALPRCAPYCQVRQTGDKTSPFCQRRQNGMFS